MLSFLLQIRCLFFNDILLGFQIFLLIDQKQQLFFIPFQILFKTDLHLLKGVSNDSFIPPAILSLILLILIIVRLMVSLLAIVIQTYIFRFWNLVVKWKFSIGIVVPQIVKSGWIVRHDWSVDFEKWKILRKCLHKLLK